MGSSVNLQMADSPNESGPFNGNRLIIAADLRLEVGSNRCLAGRGSAASAAPPASASTTVAAACFRARLARAPSPAGERTARVLAGYRRSAGDRGRGQARPFGAADLVRRSKTNQEGETTDVRFVKGGVARAIRTLRAAASPALEDRVVRLSPKMVGLRFAAAARAAGVERVTAHSGRVGLASELTSRGASTTDVMLAGNWKTSRMVAHYSAGATAERGAVARYL